MDSFFNDFVNETQDMRSMLQLRAFPPLEHLDFARKIRERIEEATKEIEDVAINFDECNKEPSDKEMVEAEKGTQTSAMATKPKLDELAVADSKVKFMDTSKNLMSNEEFRNLAKNLK